MADVPVTDERVWTVQATFMTQFMREVREAMDEAGLAQDRGKRLEVSAVVMGSLEENLFHAIDLKAWVEEGLIDTIMPYSSFEDLESMEEAWTDPAEVGDGGAFRGGAVPDHSLAVLLQLLEERYELLFGSLDPVFHCLEGGHLVETEGLFPCP